MVYWFLLTGVLLSCIYHGTASDKDWDLFIFTQEWPTAMCILAREEHQKCEVPPQIQNWTIHGLWPSKTNTKGPESCNGSWHFDESKIESLLPQLQMSWPNLFPDQPRDSFWKHEWDKHGTCSTDLPATHNELGYFSAALKQHYRYNLLEILKGRGIVPSKSQQYKIGDIWHILTESLGTRTSLTCVSHDKQVYLGQIKICISKQFTLLDCGKATFGGNSSLSNFFEDCPQENRTEVYYLPPPPSPWQQQIGIVQV